LLECINRQKPGACCTLRMLQHRIAIQTAHALCCRCASAPYCRTARTVADNFAVFENWALRTLPRE
jgi:hypothetical protein